MGDIRIEFVDFPLAKTGSTTDRALFRVFDGNEQIASVVSGISYLLLATADLSEQRPGEVLDAIRANAPTEIERLYRNGSLREQGTVDGDTYIVDLTTYNTDSGQLRRDG